MENRNNDAHRVAAPPKPAERQALPCPLCGTPSHTLSQGCLNCGWRGAFPESGTRPLSAWWRKMRAWFCPVRDEDCPHHL